MGECIVVTIPHAVVCWSAVGVAVSIALVAGWLAGMATLKYRMRNLETFYRWIHRNRPYWWRLTMIGCGLASPSQSKILRENYPLQNWRQPHRNV